MTHSTQLPICIAGTGHALPAQIVTSAAFDQRLGLRPGSLERKTGVRQRHVCKEESQIDMAVQAAQRALADASLGPGDVDLVVCASAIPYQALPATAPLILQRLGIRDGAAAAFDINATCLSFVTALEIVAAKIALGQCRSALVVSSEVASRALPWKDQPEVAALFGDGAAAAVVTGPKTGGQGIKASLMQTHPSAYDACQIGAGGTRFDFHRDQQGFADHAVFRMDGKSLFRTTRRHFPAFVETLLERAGWHRNDVDLIVPHQASPHALQHMARHLKIAPSRIVNVVADLGNQIAASIPIALDIARRDARLPEGARVLLLGTSAGVSFGGMAIEV